MRFRETYDKLQPHYEQFEFYINKKTRECMKIICHECGFKWVLFFFVPVLFFFIIAIALAETPQYTAYFHPISTSLVESSVSYFEQTFLSLHPHVGVHFVNVDQTMCLEPYNYVCKHDEPGYMEIVDYYNRKILNKMLDSEEVVSYEFMKACFQFHSQDFEGKQQMLYENPRFRHIVEEISKIQGVSDVYNVSLRTLHANGVREPFHLSILPDQTFQLDIGAPFFERDDKNEVNDYDDETRIVFSLRTILKNTFKFDQRESNEIVETYLNVRKRIASDFQQFNYVRVKDDLEREKHQLDISKWLTEQGVKSVYINLATLNILQHQSSIISIIQWKQYLLVCAIRSIFHQMRLLVPSHHGICKLQFLKYFPLRSCRIFRSNIKFPDDIAEFQKTVVTTLQKTMIEDNYFKFDMNTARLIKNELDKSEFEIDRCSMDPDNATITVFEDVFLNWKLQNGNKTTDYIDLIFEMISTPTFQERRNEDYSSYYGSLMEEAVTWSAFYDPNLDMIVAHPGALSYISRMFEKSSIQYYIELSDLFFHEVSHSFHKKSIKYATSSVKYMQYLSQVDEEINKYYGVSTGRLRDSLFKETVGDQLGNLMAYANWNATKRTDDERRAFFVARVRIGCLKDESGSNVMTDHGTRKIRSKLMFRLVQNEINRLWNCTG